MVHSRTRESCHGIEPFDIIMNTDGYGMSNVSGAVIHSLYAFTAPDSSSLKPMFGENINPHYNIIVIIRT